MINKVNLEVELDNITNQPIIILTYGNLEKRIPTTFKILNGVDYDNVKKMITDGVENLSLQSRRNKINKILNLI